jgi:hypothetical protein
MKKLTVIILVAVFLCCHSFLSCSRWRGFGQGKRRMMTIIDAEPVNDDEGKDSGSGLTVEEEQLLEKLKKMYPDAAPTGEPLTPVQQMAWDILQKQMKEPNWDPLKNPNIGKLFESLRGNRTIAELAKTEKVIEGLKKINTVWERITSPEGMGEQRWNQLWKELGDKKSESFKKEMNDPKDPFEKLQEAADQLDDKCPDKRELDKGKAKEMLRTIFHKYPHYFEEARAKGKGSSKDLEDFLNRVFPE